MGGVGRGGGLGGSGILVLGIENSLLYLISGAGNQYRPALGLNSIKLYTYEY